MTVLPAEGDAGDELRRDVDDLHEGAVRRVAADPAALPERHPQAPVRVDGRLTEPTLIQAPMENAPTPTPGHWNINDIYRKGE